MNIDARPLRIATLAHGHPSLSTGGAEIAAHSLHKVLRGSPGVSALHVSCAPSGHIMTLAGGADGNEHLVADTAIDNFSLLRRDPADPAALLGLLESFQPQVIHLHHVLGFGADLLLTLRLAFPAAVIVLTLHEFIAICHNQGQMMRTGGALCERAAPTDCNSCFPEIEPGRFVRREASLRALLSVVDSFIAPSAFLARRYLDWGLPADRMIVIENALDFPPVRQVAATAKARRGRFAYFGQMTPFKGIDILLEAVAAIPDDEWAGSSLVLHASNLERQPEAFRLRIGALIARAGPRVRLVGPYNNADLPRLMADIDWVVVPSIWWENSPLVIQEAFSNRRPVIASAIGGMAEKVIDGRNGLTFAAGDAASLARTLLRAADPKLWSSLQAGVTPPVAANDVGAWHLRLYHHMLARRARA
ncbi:glycosyltransferase family 4 protein [uncultured Devosia sp.]|uniref:glycosyltransferase family 4 protein n=1 Tax=uncultured Devosia sp. TaxID=211434 RepID=UPI0035CBEE45